MTSCHVDDDGTARVRLRLPTYFCAPNFAFLIVADAHEAVAGVDGVGAVEVVLEDHFAAGEINAGVAARSGFVASFHGLAAGELDQLRRDFLRKAVLAAQDRLIGPSVAANVPAEELSAMTLGDARPSADRERLRDRRLELGIPSADHDPLLVHPDGRTVESSEVLLHLRRARTVRVSIDANGEYCRHLLARRRGGAEG